MKAKLSEQENDQNWSYLFKTFDLCKVKYYAIVLPVVLSLISAGLEGVSLSLLAPVLDITFQGAVEAKKQSWLVGQLQDFVSIFGQFETKSLLGPLIAMIFCSELFKYFLTYQSSLMVSKLVHSFSHAIRVKLFSNYLGFGKLYFDSHSRGEMYQILTTNTRIVSMSMRSANQGISQVLMLLVYVIMMFTISWHLTVITFLVFPALHYLAEGRIAKIRKTSVDMSRSNSMLGRRINNALASIPLVKIYGTEAREESLFSNVSEGIRDSENDIDRMSLMLEPLRDAVVLVCIALLVSFIFIVSKATNAVGVGKYLVFILLLKRAARYFGALNSTKANFAEVFGPLSQIQHVLFEEKQTHIVSSGDLVFDKLLEPIVIKNLSFNYPDKSISLNNISLNIQPGTTVAVVGRSGAGKSTFVNILARFYECPEKTIFVNGKDIHNYSIKSWSNKIAMVGQDSFLFYANLRDNLTYGLDSYNENDIRDALERAGMLDFVSSLPEGLETIVGDGGVKLSGGEKQRISIARAFLRNPEIIILDEPTSSLDSQTEMEVQREIDILCKNKTVIIIAHRLSTVKHADRIVVLESGQIVEEGTLSDLIGYSGQFKKYWDAQQLPN